MQGDAEAARGRFDAALAKDANDPYALMGQNLLARRAGAMDRALTAALELVARAPQHPLAVPAARYILDQVGTSPELDDVILKGAQKALDAGALGEAAQLLRGCQMGVALVRGDTQGIATGVKDVGAASVATFVGPFSPYHELAFDETTPPEKDGSLAGPFTGPYGALTPRTLLAPDGRHRLEGEPAESDVYVLAFDAEVSEGGVYLARTVATASFKVLMDGALLFERRALTHAESTVTGRAVQLAAGQAPLRGEAHQGGRHRDDRLHPAPRGRPPLGRALHRGHRAGALLGGERTRVRPRPRTSTPRRRTSRPRSRTRRAGCWPTSWRRATAWAGIPTAPGGCWRAWARRRTRRPC